MEEKFVLMPETVDVYSARVREFLTKKNVPKTYVSKAALLADNVLLNWLEQMPEGTECKISCNVRFRRPSIVLSCYGYKFNPLNNDECMDFTQDLLGHLSLVTDYDYQDTENKVEIKLPRLQFGSSEKLLIGTLAGIATGSILLNVNDNTANQALCSSILQPVLDKFMGILGTLALFMIFFSIISSIANMDSVSKFRKLSRIISGVHSRFNVVVLIVSNIVFCFCFDILKVTDGKIKLSIFGDVLTRLLDFIPSNIVEAFRVGNTMQIVTLGVAFGIFILFLGESGNVLKKIADAFNSLFQLAIMHFTDFLPVIVFFSTTIFILNSGHQNIEKVGKVFLALFLLTPVIYLLKIAYTAKYCGYSFKYVLTNIFSLMSRGAITMSSLIVMPTMRKVMEKNFKIDGKYLDLAIPLSLIFGKTGSFIYLALVPLGMAEIFNVQISLFEVIALAICEFFFVISDFPVPSGSLAVNLILVRQIGIPSDCLAILILIEVGTDFLITSGNVMGMACGLLRGSKKMEKEKFSL